MGLFDKIKGNFIKQIGDSINGIIDNVVTNDEERMKLKNSVTKTVTGFVDKLASYQKEVLKTELSGNWLQRSWRPIVMLGFGFIVMYAKFIAPAFDLPTAELEPEFWKLLTLGIGGYIIGRSGEKMVHKVADNLDKIPKRKRK
jgi:hypothetical protein